MVDVTEQKQAKEALRQNEVSFRLLFANNPHPMWVYDAETLQFLEVNDAAIAQYGYARDELLAMRITDIRPPEDVPLLLEDLARARPALQQPREWRHRRKNGEILDVEISSHTLDFAGRPAVLIVAQDVTQRKALEALLRQSQKVEAIGRLAGGIAHDFNNLLAVIMGYTDLLAQALPSTDPLHDYVGQVAQASARAAALTQQLLAFARRQVLQPQVLDLNAVLTKMEPMLRRLIAEDVALCAVLAPTLGRVLADPHQLEQVVLNLAVNARDAMPQGGTLTIATGNVTLGTAAVRRRAPMPPGAYVQLAVSDTGCGRDAATRALLFEPFFTTKELGKGTGLGLATVYGIVKQSGGYIFVDSALGRGTTFTLYFPQVMEEPAPPPSQPQATSARGSETLLLVEDEEQVRRLARTVLEAQGYTVLAASHGEEALALSRRHEGSIHLLLTDVVMPGMSGRELAVRLVAERPTLRVLYMSGYLDDAITRHGVEAAGRDLLQKPFTTEGLAQRVRTVLEARPGSRARPGDER